ncbi:hypothetical protein Jann_3546 [Jannaschia sp. CCS1]|nr:hypothetical protein Jann_3546 [Jannaschia sp. CCS1]
MFLDEITNSDEETQICRAYRAVETKTKASHHMIDGIGLAGPSIGRSRTDMVQTLVAFGGRRPVQDGQRCSHETIEDTRLAVVGMLRCPTRHWGCEMDQRRPHVADGDATASVGTSVSTHSGDGNGRTSPTGEAFAVRADCAATGTTSSHTEGRHAHCPRQ